MNRYLLLACAGLLMVVGVITLGFVMSPNSGAMRKLSEFHGEAVGNVYVVGRYDGFLNGWDVALFHQNTQQQWLGYYLAHEARRWRDPKLQARGDVILVKNGDVTVAEYDTTTGVFVHKLQGASYTKQDGTSGGNEVAKWNAALHVAN